MLLSGHLSVILVLEWLVFVLILILWICVVLCCVVFVCISLDVGYIVSKFHVYHIYMSIYYLYGCFRVLDLC